MQGPQNLLLPKTPNLNPSYPLFLPKLTFPNPRSPRFHGQNGVLCMAGRSEKKKKKGGGAPPGRIEGDADFRRAVKEGARRKSKKLAESRFYRLHKNRKSQNQADNFTEDELQQIGLFLPKLTFPNPRSPRFHGQNGVLCMARRSQKKKKKGGGGPPDCIEGHADFRRAVKEGARWKSKKLAESRFYRLHKNRESQNQADNFTEDELQQIGLGYDRMVRFMEKDDPNLRHPYDWYKYGDFGP